MKQPRTASGLTNQRASICCWSFPIKWKGSGWDRLELLGTAAGTAELERKQAIAAICPAVPLSRAPRHPCRAGVGTCSSTPADHGRRILAERTQLGDTSNLATQWCENVVGK